MIIDSHEHVILPTEKQLENMDKGGVDKTILFTTTPHPEKAHNLKEFEQEFESECHFIRSFQQRRAMPRRKADDC